MISVEMPATTSISVTESGSTSTASGTLNAGEPAQVYAVYVNVRCELPLPSRWTAVATAAANETATAATPSQDAPARLIREPSRVSRTVPAAGANRQIQASGSTASVPQRRQRVDVEGHPAAGQRDHEAEPDDHLGRGHRHDDQREDLARGLAHLARERDQRQVAGVQHDLDREQQHDRAAPGEHAEQTDPEQHRRDADEPLDADVHQCLTSGSSAGTGVTGKLVSTPITALCTVGVTGVHSRSKAPGSPTARDCGRRVPRTTPPTAATSSRIEVASNASR